MKKRDATIARCDDGDPRTGRTAWAGRFALGVLLIGASVLAVGCTQESPRQIALGKDIEVGPYVFRVLRAQDGPNPPPPISTFRSQPGKKGIVVFLDWKKLDDEMDMMRRLAFIESFLENQLSIEDSDGRRSEASGAMQARLMDMQDPGRDWRDWVAVFHVPEETRGLTLLVENPEPSHGQARVTAVPLGM